MIDAKPLKDDLVAELKVLEKDLRTRIDELPALKADLTAEWNAARDANRCAETFESWADQVITQAGVHWLLACVFLRFIEDNGLIERPWLSGTRESGRRALAEDRHEAWFREHPEQSDRDYLFAAFRDCASLAGLATFFDEAHNPLYRLEISGIAAMRLRAFWLATDADTGTLLRDFTDETLSTRFLGDLYQDLSEATRKRYALLQTPEFVEEFILDRTLDPAIAEFGWRTARLIDPTCGSGHFLLGAFRRFVEHGFREAPGINAAGLAQIALDAVAGVDLNPFAVAIARFRLMVAALQVAGVKQLKHAPNFVVHVAIGDSLLHGPRFGLTETEDMFESRDAYAGTGLEHAYASEDLDQARKILGRQYHAVVGNPPYIVVEDAKLNVAYRNRYESCAGQYSLGVPFTERFFELAIRRNGDSSGAGFIGLITANSFMKREFGPKLVTKILPRFELTHIVDTSGAYIPGHGTPTVILFGRNRNPILSVVRTILGINGEPSTPTNPAEGRVWKSIIKAIDRDKFEDRFISSDNFAISKFRRHPWRIGGGGAAELSDFFDEIAKQRFGKGSVVSGTGRTSADEAFVLPLHLANKQEWCGTLRDLVDGESVKDWSLNADELTFSPYHRTGIMSRDELSQSLNFFWSVRTILESRVTFSKKTYRDEGRAWWGWHQITLDRLNYRFFLAFAEIATHNHFVLDRGGKVFKQTAPVIKLPADATEDDHLGLLGLLNSSVACFWFKQVGHCKGNGGINGGIASEQWEKFFVYNSSVVAEAPLPESRPLPIARQIDAVATAISQHLPAALLANHINAARPNAAAAASAPPLLTRAALDAARSQVESLRRQAIAWQEELDWQVYAQYGLLDTGTASSLRLPDGVSPPEVRLGERAFEIVLARRVAAGDEQTTWFERHGSTPVTEVASHWPADYRALVELRIALIGQDRNIGLIERPEYKRRWNSPDWADLESKALRAALLDRLEAPHLWPASDQKPPQLITTARLADLAGRDATFVRLAELYKDQRDPDLTALVAELVAAEAVPFLPVQRYTETGLRKRAQWQATWALQRREDVIDAEVEDRFDEIRRAFLDDAIDRLAGKPMTDVILEAVERQAVKAMQEEKRDRKAYEIGPIPVPPKYIAKDFLKASYWSLRGGLDVPKERFISYPGCSRSADPSPTIAWAGWNPLQQATALASHYMEMKDIEGWEADRLTPLLAGLDELVPWLKQWHNDHDPATGERLGDYYEAFTADEAKSHGLTLADLRAWKPAVTAVKRGRKAKAAG